MSKNLERKKAVIDARLVAIAIELSAKKTEIGNKKMRLKIQKLSVRDKIVMSGG